MIKGQENVPEPAIKYKLSKKLGCWVRTWFTIEVENKQTFFKQHNAFSTDRNKEWDKWSTRPVKG